MDLFLFLACPLSFVVRHHDPFGCLHNILSMFYEIKNLLTSIIVAPYEMQILAKDSELIKRLKERMEGRCLVEYGYIIKILTEGYKISDPVVQ